MRLTGVVVALVATGCDTGLSASTGAREPVRVANAQFFEGPIPTAVPEPTILTIDSQNNLLVQGQGGKKLSGVAKKTSTAVAVRFTTLGTGYWVVPVGPPDPQTPGDLTWEAVCDFARDIPVGKHDLAFAASNAVGVFGPTNTVPLLVESLVPAGKVVVSLAWDSAADLDLHLLGPTGRDVSPKHPTSAVAVDGGLDALPPGTGVLDRDANAGCVQDGSLREDIVFADAPPKGLYQVRVDMFDACAAPAASFVITIRIDGKVALERKGRLLDIDADGGGPGLFVAELAL